MYNLKTFKLPTQPSTPTAEKPAEEKVCPNAPARPIKLVPEYFNSPARRRLQF